MTVMRRCSRIACGRAAVATLTYVYADQTAVLGPLATYAEPHTYDLCAGHADRLTVPQGWDVVRLIGDLADLAFADGPADDLLAVAEAVRERPASRRGGPYGGSRQPQPPLADREGREGRVPAEDGARRGAGANRNPATSSAARAEQRANRRAHLRVLRDG